MPLASDRSKPEGKRSQDGGGETQRTPTSGKASSTSPHPHRSTGTCPWSPPKVRNTTVSRSCSRSPRWGSPRSALQQQGGGGPGARRGPGSSCGEGSSWYPASEEAQGEAAGEIPHPGGVVHPQGEIHLRAGAPVESGGRRSRIPGSRPPPAGSASRARRRGCPWLPLPEPFGPSRTRFGAKEIRSPVSHPGRAVRERFRPVVRSVRACPSLVASSRERSAPRSSHVVGDTPSATAVVTFRKSVPLPAGLPVVLEGIAPPQSQADPAGLPGQREVVDVVHLVGDVGGIESPRPPGGSPPNWWVWLNW